MPGQELRKRKRARPVGQRATQPSSRAGRPLRCARCGRAITEERHAMDVGGKHLHLCLNPGGILYRVRCFRRAPGCRQLGGESDYWPWFPGYTWQVEVCADCGGHLGWRFQSDEDAFHGLIAERLVEPPEGEPLRG